MKKIIFSALCAILLVLAVGGVVSSAYFGSGVAVLAKEVSVIKSGLYGRKVRFSDSDFKCAFALSDFSSIKISSLPSPEDGTLLLAGRRVKAGQSIKRKNIGALVFVPASDKVDEASFEFIMNGQCGNNPVGCYIKFTDKINHAPEEPRAGEVSLSVTTQSDISVYGHMEACDPEGDSLEFMVIKYPKHGRLSILDKTAGSYKYTPKDGYTGLDSFTYVARDSYGNYSEPVSISLKTVKRMSGVVYSDMNDREEYNAAVAMSALGIMDGRRIGGGTYFCPDETVTKAEFVAMAMKAYGITPDPSLKMTFFDDNNKIPEPLMSYIATAQKRGIIDGDLTEEGLVFNPGESINLYNAASVMSRIMELDTEGEDDIYTENETVPIWARADVYAMCTLGIFRDDAEAIDGGIKLTRGMTAEYLYRMINA